jgi:hypothetical protein
MRARNESVACRWAFVVIGALGALAPSARPSAAQEAFRLSLSGSPGEWLRYSARSELLIDLPADLGGPTTTRTTISWLDLVQGVIDGSIEYLTTIERITVDARPAPSEVPDLSPLQGLQFHRTASRNGRTLDVRLSGREEAAGPGLLEQVQSWLARLGLPPLPEAPVRVGDTWSETIPVPAMALGLAVDYDVVQVRTVRLDAVRAAGRSRVAFLSVTTDWAPTSEASGAGGTISSIRGTARQTVRFDVDRGRFLGSTGTSQLEFVLRPPGGAQYVAVAAAGNQVTGLADSGDTTR